MTLAVTTLLSPAVYGSWWFILLWAIFAVVLACAMFTVRMWRRPGSFLLHISFIAILSGGLATWLTQEKGMVRIEPGMTVNSFTKNDGNPAPLPEEITLERFEVIYYPGGVAPRDYVSHLIVRGEPRNVSMNNILDLDGYRLYQSSYDSTGATVLSVNHDPYGIPLSYAGYVMFALGGLLILLSPNGRFRSIIKGLGVAGLLLAAGCPGAYASKITGVPRESADSLRTRQVVYGGRTVTFNTLSRDVVRKLYGKPSYRGLTPEQTLLSLRLYPSEWKKEPLILIKDKDIRKALGLKGKYAALSNLFDSVGNYRVEQLPGRLGSNHRRAIEELDEKVGIVLMLYSGDLIVAASPADTSLPEWRVRLELFYNAVPFTMIIFILLFTGGIVSLVAKMGIGRLTLLATLLLWISFIVTAIVFIVEWILAGRLPVSNTFETLQFTILAIEIIILLAARKNTLLQGMGMMFAGALALVAHLVATNPVVTPLMPVLHSPWLSLHVSLVMTAYSLLGFTFVIAIVALLRPAMAGNLKNLSMAMLYPGVWLLGLGIFSGAVWANVSWGQYWSWDPKETWALITLMVYAVPLHTSVRWPLSACAPLSPNRSTAPNQSWFQSPRRYHAYLLLAILAIAMTYFGVNHLNSLHAYT